MHQAIFEKNTIVGAIFEQGGKKLEATKFLLIWLLYDPNGQDPKGF